MILFKRAISVFVIFSFLGTNANAQVLPNLIPKNSVNVYPINSLSNPSHKGEGIAVNGASINYDANGNLASEGGKLYSYDEENRLTQMSKGSTIAQYGYDGFNRRVSKTVGGVPTYYVHDGDQVVEEHNSAGALVADYVNGPSIDEVLTMSRGGQTYYYFYDGLGSVRTITDSAGTIIEKYDYDVYGKPTKLSTIGNPVMFTGRWYDPESSNYYYRARQYSPTLGRFLQRDPIGYYDSMNLYQYVSNNPTNWIDPSGECFAAVAEAAPIIIVVMAAYLASQMSKNKDYSPIKLPQLFKSDKTDDGKDNANKNLSDKEGEISKKTGLPVKEVKEKIHEAKTNLPKSGPIRNPDVYVDTHTGEIYPKIPGGGHGDSIGNIFD